MAIKHGNKSQGGWHLAQMEHEGNEDEGQNGNARQQVQVLTACQQSARFGEMADF